MCAFSPTVLFVLCLRDKKETILVEINKKNEAVRLQKMKKVKKHCFRARRCLKRN